jgi:hypothetical protein
LLRDLAVGQASSVGTPYFTPLTEPLDLRLTESRTFSSRVVYLRYQRMR